MGNVRPPPRGATGESARIVQGVPDSPRRADPLKAWGPLARAVISAEAFLDVDAAAMDEREAAVRDRGARRRKWPLILLLVVLAGGLAAVAWWLRARA
jgi:hypothetical protein